MAVDHVAPPPTLGWLAADWIETHCVHGPGDIQGEPARLTDEAIQFLVDAYELEPVTGRRRYKRAMLVRPKGWAKSELAAFTALFEALGPCRFAEWDDDGTPLARPIQTPIIRIIATEENQAGNIYDNIYFNLSEGPLAHTPGIDAGMTRILLPNGGSIRPVSAGSASKDGGRETFVCFDELHLFILPELHRLHATYLRNLRKRKGSDPWSLETTTAYRPGEGSVAEGAMGYAKKIAAGEILDGGFLYDHRQPRGTYDLEQPDDRRAALLEAFGDCDWVDIDQIVKDWDDPTTDRVDWQRYYLSRVVVTADQFLDPADWAALVAPTASLADGDMVCIGIDTSLVDDGTAVVACRPDGYLERLGYWQRPPGRAGLDWQVPYSEVDECVRSAMARFRVLRLYADPQYCHSLLDDWQLDFGKIVFSWPTTRTIAMAAAIQRFYVAVKTRELSHNGDTLMARHIDNSRTFESQGRTLIRKEYRHSPKKIDITVASVLAFEAVGDAIAAGEHIEQPVKRKVWSYR